LLRHTILLAIVPGVLVEQGRWCQGAGQPGLPQIADVQAQGAPALDGVKGAAGLAGGDGDGDRGSSPLIRPRPGSGAESVMTRSPG